MGDVYYFGSKKEEAEQDVQKENDLIEEVNSEYKIAFDNLINYLLEIDLDVQTTKNILDLVHKIGVVMYGIGFDDSTEIWRRVLDVMQKTFDDLPKDFERMVIMGYGIIMGENLKNEEE